MFRNTNSAGAVNVMTTLGDMIVGGAAGAPTRFGKGADTQVLTMVSGNEAWASPVTGFTNPMTTAGDLILGGASGVPGRLAKGTGTQVLTMASGNVTWAAATGSGGGGNATLITGMDGTGATDSTAAIQAAITALPAGGGNLLIPYTTGFYRFNLVIAKDGVTITGAGTGKVGGSGYSNYCAPWNDTLPVIQIGNDTANFQGIMVRDICLYTPAGTGNHGLVFAGGAYKCGAMNLQSIGFTKTCLKFTSATGFPCTFNLVTNFMATSNQLGVHGIHMDCSNTAHGTAWTTANEVSQFSVTNTNGHQLYVDGATGSLANGYLQGAYSGRGIYLKKSAGYYYDPVIEFSNVDLDSVSGYGNVTTTVDVGADYRTPSQIRNIIPLSGTLYTGANIFHVAGHTTGSITAGLYALTVASTTGIIPGREILVEGAGVEHNPLVALVVSISGSVVTLNTAATYTVASVDVGYGDIGVYDCNSQGSNFMSAPGWAFSSSTRGDLVGGCPGVFSAGYGTVAPFDSADLIFDMRNRGKHTIQQYYVPTISTITQSGYVVTVTMSGNHNAGVGDLINIDGVLQTGINGTWKVATYVSASVLTFTSTVSQTLGAVTGTPTMAVFKQCSYQSGIFNVSSAGIGMRNQLGVMGTLVYHNTSNGGCNFASPDTANGYLSFSWGASVSGTSTGCAFGDSNATKVRLTASGHTWMIKAAAPGSSASGGYFYVSSVDSQCHASNSAGNDGVILTSASAAASATTAAPTLTASTTGVMMGAAGTITPLLSSRILVTICGMMANSVAASGATVSLRYGTGTKPANAAAMSGTVAGAAQTATSVAAGQKTGFSITAVVTGLTQATAYWLDASLAAVTSGNATLTGVTITAVEI